MKIYSPKNKISKGKMERLDVKPILNQDKLNVKPDCERLTKHKNEFLLFCYFIQL